MLLSEKPAKDPILLVDTAVLNDATLENWKIGVNTCIANKLNYADLGITNNKITSLQTVTPTTGSTTYDRWSLK